MKRKITKAFKEINVTMLIRVWSNSERRLDHLRANDGKNFELIRLIILYQFKEIYVKFNIKYSY